MTAEFWRVRYVSYGYARCYTCATYLEASGLAASLRLDRHCDSIRLFRVSRHTRQEAKR